MEIKFIELIQHLADVDPVFHVVVIPGENFAHDQGAMVSGADIEVARCRE